jgi:hypothetical protein
MEEKLFGADNTEVVWFAELTEAMVAHLGPYELSALCEELSDAIARACTDYEVN